MKNTKSLQRVVTWNGQGMSKLRGADGRSTFKYKFSYDGGNKMNGGMLHMDGGRTLIKGEGLNKQLLDSCKASNELSLVVHLDTQSLKQSGPARILSFSLNSMKRNFTLCQEKDKLVLRLRTTATGENGSNPEVVLSKLEENQKKKVVITYRSGQLETYIDGKSISIQQIKGDFSNWEACHLVFGNEWKDDRPWKGRIHQFNLFSSVLPPEKALALSK